MRQSIVAAFVIMAVVGGYCLVATRQRAPTVEAVSIPSQEPASAVESSATAADAAPTLGPPLASPEQRAETIKDAMRESMSGVRSRYIEELMARGLARSDSERIVDEFAAGIADCVFEAARAANESRGYTLDEFLHGAEMIWSDASPQIDPQRLPSGAVACAANVAQQAGLSVAFEPRNRPRSEPAVPASGMHAGEMEAAIRSHIANHAELALSDLLVHCEARGCEIFMQGREIQIFDLEFDRFAEVNGFQHAVLGGDASFRTVWLQR